MSLKVLMNDQYNLDIIKHLHLFLILFLIRLFENVLNQFRTFDL